MNHAAGSSPAAASQFPARAAAALTAAPPLAPGRPEDDLDAMDTFNAEAAQTPEVEETEAERQDRLAWEAEGIAKADADIAAGRLVDAAAVRAWVQSIDTDHELPIPFSGR